MLKRLLGTTKTKLWMIGSDPFDIAIAEDVLAIAREQFGEDAEEALFNNPEIYSATFAVVQALPKRLRNKVTDEAFRDIASILLLQRAAEGYKIGLVAGNGSIE